MVKGKQNFGKTLSGENVYLFSLQNTKGMTVEIITYGATIRGICLPNNQQVVLGLATIEEYQQDTAYLGAVVGRVANRISNASFQYNSADYVLSQNNGKHHLHGGYNGLSFKNWEVVEDSDKLILKCVSCNLEDGYPGDLEVIVTYLLNNENELSVSIEATCNKVTPLSITIHPYFNLGESLQSHYLQIPTSLYIETNDDLIPTGSINNVSENITLDFLKSRQLQSVLTTQGIDTNYCFNNTNTLQLLAYLRNSTNTTSLKVYTTYPGLQVYTADFLPNGNYQFHEGGSQAAICLEPQFWPDFVNNSSFEGCFLQPNQLYTQQIVYKFETNT